MSFWPSCDSFVGFGPQNICIGPQDYEWVTFGKPAINKTVEK